MSRLGISNTDTVVVYDAEGGLWCARLWWLMRYMDTATRNSCMAVWASGDWKSVPSRKPMRSSGIRFSRAGASGTASYRQPGSGRTGQNERGHPGCPPSGSLQRKTADDAGLAGHIPSAKNVPAPSNLDAAQQLLPAGKLAGMYAKVGANRGTPIITYCGGGYYGAFTTYVLYQLGYENVRLYDGSWAEWISEGGAVETGP